MEEVAFGGGLESSRVEKESKGCKQEGNRMTIPG